MMLQNRGQKVENSVSGKQHPILNKLHRLASRLLTRRCSARLLPQEALQEVQALIGMRPILE